MDIYIYDKIPCDCGQGYLIPVRIYEENRRKPREKIIDIVWQCPACRKKVTLMPALALER